MKKRWLPALALLLTGNVGAQDGDPAFHWRTDLAEATREAAREGRPLLVVFR
jgi:hypothetical protein